MRLLCSGSDLEKLERTRKELVHAGVRCELRRDIPAGSRTDIPTYPEIWINSDDDFPIAVRVFSRLASLH